MATFQSFFVPQDGGRRPEVEVLVQFANVDIADSAGYIYLVVLENHAGVVINSVQLLHLPLPFRIGSRQHESSGIVPVDEQIEFAFVGSQSSGPHALGIRVLTTDKTVFVRSGKLFQRLCTILPVDQIM